LRKRRKKKRKNNVRKGDDTKHLDIV